MRKCLNAVLLLLLVYTVSLFLAAEAGAIPAFTRQHKTECSTCHTIYPELNEYGQAFLKNAYVYAEKTPKGAPVAGKGEAGHVAEKNEGVLLSGIPELFPFSATATQSITYNEHAPGDNWDFATRSLVLQAGGAFRQVAGFYATYNLFTHDSFGTSNNDKLDELFVMGRRVFKTPINIKFGRFEPRLGLWKRSDKVLATSFATYSYRLGGPDSFRLEKPQDALEVNAVLGNRIFLATGIVDIEGQSTKDAYGHFSVKFGGADFLGNEPAIDFDEESIWDYLTLTFAGYGYAGRSTDTPGSSIRNNFYRAGGDADILYKRLRIRVSGVTGRDTNPTFLVPEEENSLVIASEAEYQFGSPINVIGVFRYEYQEDASGITRRYIPAVVYAPLQNMRLALQYNIEDNSQNTDKFALMTVAYSF